MGGHRFLRTFVLCAVLVTAAHALAGASGKAGMSGKTGKALAIDSYCKQLQSSLQDQTPFIFAGPDPWTEMDDIPASMPDEAVAYVYTTGGAIRWVFMRLVDREEHWSEDLNYFYREDGTLAKRVRQLSSDPANMNLEVTSYFENGKQIKQSHKRHSLHRGSQDPSRLIDPDAPIYWTTDDLPFPDILDPWQRIA